MSSDEAESGSESISSEGEEVGGDMFEIGYWESENDASEDMAMTGEWELSAGATGCGRATATAGMSC